MAKNQKFIHDRGALLLVSINAFLALVAIVLISLRLNASKGTANYIVTYRGSLGIDSYMQGSATDIASFIVAAVLVLLFAVFIGYRSYPIRRELSLAVLGLSVLLLALIIIVSNALLILR